MSGEIPEAARSTEAPVHHAEVESPQVMPRIYVASLSDYNAGRLHGAWIDAAQDYDDLIDEVNEMLANSSEPVAEEHAIHDYEGFGPLRLDEYENLETVCEIAAGIAEHGPAFAGWAAQLDRAEWGRLDRFAEHYLGHWDSTADYAADMLTDLGIDLDEIGPEILQPYVRVDLDAYARDLEYDLVVVEDDDQGGVHIFSGDA